jgi:hypothetical protein
LDGRADHSDLFGAEDLVEGVAESRVEIADKKPERLVTASADRQQLLWELHLGKLEPVRPLHHVEGCEDLESVEGVADRARGPALRCRR